MRVGLAIAVEAGRLSVDTGVPERWCEMAIETRNTTEQAIKLLTIQMDAYQGNLRDAGHWRERARSRHDKANVERYNAMMTVYGQVVARLHEIIVQLEQ